MSIFHTEATNPPAAKKIYLSLQVRAGITDFDHLGDIARTDMGDLFSKYREIGPEVHEYIVRAIADTAGDLLIGDISPAPEMLITAAERIAEQNAVLECIFIPSEKYRAAMLGDAQSLNRWMDFPPGHIETVHEANGKKLAEARDYFLSAGIKVVEI